MSAGEQAWLPSGIVCQTCGEPMVLRTNRSTGIDFLGCSRFPECQATMPIPEHVWMRQQGALPLPGMEDL